MSIASRLTSIEKHIEEAYTEISRLGVDLTNVDKNIDNIADKLQEAYSQAPKVTGEGSNLSLSPTRKGGLTIIPKGACEQDSYSGKNKCSNAYFYNENGIWFDYEPSTFQKTFTISFIPHISVSGLQMYIQGTGGNIGITGATESITSGTRYTKTITLSDANYELVIGRTGTSHISLYKSNAGMDTTSAIDEPQIEFNNAFTSYELYVGGIPSPNPDFPQDIRVVTGDNEVVVHSQNLLDISKKYTGGTPDSEDYLTNSHTGTSSDYYMNIWFNKGGLLKPNTDYLLVIEVAELTRTTSITINDNNAQSPFTSSGSLQKSLSANNTYVIPVKTKANITNTYDLRAYFYLPANVSLSYKLRLSIIEDLTTTAQTFMYRPFGMQTYTLHLGTNYFAGIDTYDDEIAGKTDDWKIIKNIKKLALSSISGPVSGNTNYITISDRATTTTEEQFIYCNKLFWSGNYNGVGNADLRMKKYQIAVNNNGTSKNIFIKNTDFTTKTQFDNWYSTLDAQIYYPLATPVEIPITDQTLITDLNNMYQAMGYDGTTNITITSDSNNAQMIASVSALKGE